MRFWVPPTDGSQYRPGALPISPPRGYLIIRGIFERAAALLLLAIVSPMLALLALAVRRTSAGPALYCQLRLGRNGNAYWIYKLRTMEHNCEATTGPVWSLKHDPRVTRIGRFLRDTHLDELPQLWNVVRGEMSLIGPRPERPEFAGRLERRLPGYADRLRIKPGMTGLAQLLLPPDSDLDGVQRKLAYDLHYIRSLGLGIDVRIALATCLYVVGRGLHATSACLLGPNSVAGVAPASETRPDPFAGEFVEPIALPIAA